MLLSDSRKEQGKSNKRNKKNSDTRRLSASGIGLIVFGLIFLYFIITIAGGFLRNRVETYEVMEGSLTDNLTFTGCAVREETCVTANHPDSFLLVRENEKIARGDLLFADSGALSEAGPASSDSENEIRKAADAFLFSFSGQNFSTVYSFKRELLNIGAAVYKSADPDILKHSDTVTVSPCDGIVSTAVDGYEGTTIDDVTSPGFSWSVKKAEENTGSVKVVSSEEWSLVIPVTDKQVISLSNITRAKVTFLSDGETEQASVKWLRTEDGSSFLSLQFSSGLIRYLKDRFISVRIEAPIETGLKVPASAVLKETFYKIPERCLYLSGESSGVHFMRFKKNEDGTFVTDAKGDAVSEMVSPTVYCRQKEDEQYYYYVSTSVFSEGDELQVATEPDEPFETYTVGETEEFTGVYQVNNGYALFRRVEIMDRNDIWCLVKKGTGYGIIQHDFIVYDSSKAKDSMIVTR